MRIESKPAVARVLLVRNDNIGDLVCSIPAIQLMRQKFSSARLDLLVNSYNAPVVKPLVPEWVDRLIVYRKTKHLGWSVPQVSHLTTFYLGLRRARYDLVILLGGGFSRQARSWARWTGAPRVIGYGAEMEGPAFEEGRHEVEYSWRLAAWACGIQEPPPSEIQYPVRAEGTRTGIQITSRKPGNRWDESRFTALAREITTRHGQPPLLIWSPGGPDTPTHPGDDAKAAEIALLAGKDVELRPTTTIPGLVTVLRECRTLITPDGGAMHLAAAMGLRVVAMFGQSEPSRWRPWTPRARVLQSTSRTIQDIPVKQVVAAWQELENAG